MALPYEDYPTRGTPGEKITLNSPYSFGCPSSFSPFSAKIELYLRVNNLPYDYKAALPLDKKIAPRKKVPTIHHGATLVPDSYFIIKYLENTYGEQLLIKPIADKEQRGKAAAAQIIVEHFTSYSMVPFVAYDKKALDRLTDNPGFYMFPKMIRKFAAGRLVKKISKKSAQVLGYRHSEKDFLELHKYAAQALSDLLGDQAFYGGEQMSKEDCAIWGQFQVFLNQDVYPPVREVYTQFPNLVEYKDRVEELYFPESNPSIIKTATEEYLKTHK